MNNMKYTRIINNIPTITYSEDFIENNNVEGWVFAPHYTGTFLYPKWNGENYYESATQSDFDRIHQEKIKEYNTNQYQELSPTDWYFTRFIETGVEVPEEIKNERNAIRIKYDLLKNS